MPDISVLNSILRQACLVCFPRKANWSKSERFSQTINNRGLQQFPERRADHRSPNDGFLLNALQTLQNTHLSGAIKFVSVRWSKGNLSLFETTRASYYFPVNFRCNFKFYESENFFDSSLNRIFESKNVRFPFSTKNRLTCALKCEKLNFRKSWGIY